LTAVLSLRDADYEWRGRKIVRSASLDVEVGTLTVVIGPNGAGKSTLLRLLSGELRPTRGATLGLGERLDALAPWRLAGLRAVMTQAVDIAFPFTAVEVVGLGLETIGRSMGRAAQAETVARCLAAADAAEFARQSYESLSGGEKRRIHFARALAQLEAGRSLSPLQALLLDEPVASLDFQHQLTLLDEARRIARQGVAVLAVLHDINLAVRYADLLAVVKGGEIVARGPKDRLLQAPLLSAAFGVELSVGARVAAREALVLPSAWLDDKQEWVESYAEAVSSDSPR
jgi:iron complex transport system ATP-binding protein